MEPFDSDELSEQELNQLLQEWKAPPVPVRLRASLFAQAPRGSLWTQFWNRSIRVPLPAAFAIALVGVIAVWRLPAWVSPRSLPAIQAPGDPAEQVPANRRRPASQDREQLRPVMELKPVIIGRSE